MYGKWYKWRTDRITEIVKYVYKNVKNYDLSVEVSAAVFATPKLAYEYAFQDGRIGDRSLQSDDLPQTL